MPTSVVGSAPTRICDCGGWTDTWFARHGAVLHLAITPGVRVRVTAREDPTRHPEVAVQLANFGETYSFTTDRLPGRHPLIEAAVAVSGPAGMALDVTVASEMPPGASTGTSASLVVALLAALAYLRGESPTPADLARAAHRLETDHLGLQSGVQDQIAAAYGGINFIEMPSYPDTRVLPVSVQPEIRAALDHRLVLIFLGRAHRSSDVHKEVIRAIADGSSGGAALDALRRAAVSAREALAAGDIEAFAAALTANTLAQQQLHPSLVGADATRLIAAAEMVGARGWKINGAGGTGGSVALMLGPEEPSLARVRLLERVSTVLPRAREIPMRLSVHGAAIESSPG